MIERFCFHCDEPIVDGLEIELRWKNKTREFCCYGCQSVAQAIIDNGLDDYYQFRTENSVKPDQLVPQELRELLLLDDQTIQQSFVSHSGSFSEAELGVEGITCAACSWLIESRLLKEPGVQQVQVNPITHRLKLKWNNEQQKLSDLMQKLLALGFKSYPFQQNQQELSTRRENRNYLMRLGVAGLGMMQVMMFAIGLYLGETQSIAQEHETFLHWVSGIVATPIVFYAAFPFFRNAWMGIKARHLVMDVPVVIAISTAYLSSVWATLSGTGQVYFDSVSMFIFFLLLGRFLEHRVRTKAIVSTQTQRQLLPHSVTKIDNNSTQDIPLHQVQVNDRILIRTGETIPVDGIIAEGNTHIDESLMTGEVQPQQKGIGDVVFAGTVNVSQSFHLTATAIGKNTYFAALERMTQEAHLNKPPIGYLADRIAHWFVAGILLLVLAVYLGWSFVDTQRAFWISLSVLVVSCPCALSLATPTALTTASHHLSKLGLLILKSHTLQTLSEISLAVFDKTGTLTKGELAIENISLFSSLSEDQVIQTICALERQNTHPVARVFHPLDKRQFNAEHIVEHPGLGIEGHVNHRSYKVGKSHFVSPGTLSSTAELTEIFLSENDTLLASISLRDKLKEDASLLIQRLHEQKISCCLLSGDSSNQVQIISNELQLDEFYNNLSPAEKAEKVKFYQKNHKVLMVGDGLNDTLVLAQADVGIAVNNAADLTQINADAVLTQNSLLTINNALQLAKKTQKIIRQNLTWALGYNLIAIPLAAAGLVAPWQAAIGMTASSLLVVVNALRLRFKASQ